MLEMPEMDDASKLRVGPIATGLVLVLGVFSSGAANIEDIVPLAEKSAAPGPSITKEEEEIAHRVRSLGPQGIPYLLPLLKEDVKEEVRELASYILSDMEGLTEEHLDALIESRRNGDVWIPPAIARVGTPKAIAFLVEELKGVKGDDPQLVSAFYVLGERAVPPCVEFIKTGSPNGSADRTVLNIFRRLGEKAESAVGPLTEFISNKQSSESSVVDAVMALGAIGPKARAAVPALLALTRGRFDTPQWVDHALATMGAPEALPRLIQRLEQPMDYYELVFQDIASFKENGREAGPALVRCLRQNRFGRRDRAARTLGYIGYVEAIPDLMPLLQSSDWRVVYASAEALGRLHVTDALGPLGEIAESYWHPGVHEVANKAVRVIRGTAQYGPGVSLYDYGSADAFNQDDCIDSVRSDINHFYVRQRDHLSREQLKKLAYKTEITSEGVGWDGRTPEQHVTPLHQVPSVGMPVEGGCLIGSDRGEWGGELVFLDSEGYRAILLHDNVRGIYRMASGIVVVTGLSHLGMSHGAVYKVWKGNDGTWGVATRWVVLPDAPIVSGVRPNGNLFVACYKGTVEISPSGDVKTVDR